MITKEFGRTGRQVTVVGLGGEGILRTHGQEEKAEAVISTAIAEGITYFDSARVYAGSEGYYGARWTNRPEQRTGVFQTSKSASRDKQGALRDLEMTLATLGTSHLDLWQIHDVRTEGDLRAITGPGGAMQAFLQAKAAGKTRFIGVTGHHDPRVLTKAVKEWPVDAVLMPVNPVEGALGGFLDSTLPQAKEKGIAVIGMKVLGASYYLVPEFEVTPQTLICYALSQGITLAIVGCRTPEEVKTLARVGREFTPLTPEDQHELVQRFTPLARELAYYRGVF
jgi:aryl-alcohol dehydrogenase-like predicted oxidoreductase